MNMESVVSSNLNAVGYDGQNSILRIAFNNGGVYEYDGVPEVVYHGLMNASSKGCYFHVHIKNRFETRKII